MKTENELTKKGIRSGSGINQREKSAGVTSKQTTQAEGKKRKRSKCDG